MSIYVAIVPSFNRPVAEHSNFHVPRHSLSGQSNAVETCTDASTTLSSREGFRSTVKKKRKRKERACHQLHIQLQDVHSLVASLSVINAHTLKIYYGRCHLPLTRTHTHVRSTRCALLRYRQYGGQAPRAVVPFPSTLNEY